MLRSRLKSFVRIRSPGRWFWVINLGLLILYAWTLSEQVSIVIERADGRCTAVLLERQSSISCPGLEGGHLGLYLESGPLLELSDLIKQGPLDEIASSTAWKSLHWSLSRENPDINSIKAQEFFSQSPRQGVWGQIGDGLLARPDGPSTRREAPIIHGTILGYGAPLPLR